MTAGAPSLESPLMPRWRLVATLRSVQPPSFSSTNHYGCGGEKVSATLQLIAVTAGRYSDWTAHLLGVLGIPLSSADGLLVRP